MKNALHLILPIGTAIVSTAIFILNWDNLNMASIVLYLTIIVLCIPLYYGIKGINETERRNYV